MSLTCGLLDTATDQPLKRQKFISGTRAGPTPHFHSLRVENLTGVWAALDEVAVPRYFLAIRWPDGRKQDDPGGTFLPNEAAALSYAERTIESLRKESGYDDPGLMMFVRNERQQIVLSIPFLPACA
jgi:hypothetical protein